MCLTNTSLIMTNSSSLINKNDEILHVIYDYTGKEDDELTLKRGSIVEVLSKDEKISGSEGWWTGRLIDSESVGIFPANFVGNFEPNLRVIEEKDLQIGNLIGIGGFGHVHYGKFGDIDVAIKTAKSLTAFSSIEISTASKSHDDESSDAVKKNLIDGLLHEACLFSNLRHRNIIQLFGVSPSISTRNLYLVMEYAHGGALNNLLQRRKSGLYPNVFIQYAKQIVDGMKYLHEEAVEHIIHRDLKCSNILILEAIENIHNESELLYKTLKITDFGLARKQLQSSSMSAAGTFPWMSPECIRNNEFSTKSDVWSFGVLLWECLTGEIPYKGFDQMQVAFGIATNKYSLPIPSTCPEEFSQLMKDCWQLLPKDRPTFSELYEQINKIIEINYTNNDLSYMETNDETYSSLQQDWRKEIQDIFEELKTKEQEIRDREQAMLQLTIQQNHQRMRLQQWEQELHEREMHIIERELKLLMSTNNQERLHQQTPKVQKRSGHFGRSLLHAALNGSATLSSTTASNLISGPTNFRHLMSICREQNLHHHPAIDYDSSSSSSSTNPNTTSPIQISCSTNNILPSNSISTQIHSDLSNNQSTTHNVYTSQSTPTTPNLNRLRTLTSSGDLIINVIDDKEPLISNDGKKTKYIARYFSYIDDKQYHNIVHVPVLSDEFDDETIGKTSRSSSTSQDKIPATKLQHSRWRKPKQWTSSSSSSSTTTIKRKYPKTNTRLGESKWYIEPTSSMNSNNDDTTISSTKSTPTMDRSTQKTGSSSSSTCSTPNDRSLARGIYDINSMLISVGLGRPPPPVRSNFSEFILSGPSFYTSSSSSSSTTTIIRATNQSILRSTSETTNTQRPSLPTSTDITSSPSIKKQHKRTCSSPLTDTITQTNGFPNMGCGAIPFYSPIRPDSLTFSSKSPPLSSAMTNISQSDSHLVDSHFNHRNQSTKITNPLQENKKITHNHSEKFRSTQSNEICSPMTHSIVTSSNISTSQPQLHRSCILDIDSEEQKTLEAEVLAPEIDRKRIYNSNQDLDAEFFN
ncbi:unnamed protein product [Rotaria sp. Silwood1]|nr:unnamed protein product [Rotaria sp. Silwood1]CAF4582314.1 unnamed protein product [Rotaria sp. Silwood1]